MKVIFEKWVDPFEARDRNPYVSESDYFDDEDDHAIDVDDYESGFGRKTSAAAVTIYGLYPVNYHSDSSKTFNHWIGHTDFPINAELADLIDNFPGVEIFDLSTPYRFKICIGRAFNESDVIPKLKHALMGTKPPPTPEELIVTFNEEVRDKIKETVESLKQQGGFWHLLVLPNKDIEVSRPVDIADFKAKKKILEDVQQLTHGVLLSSQ